MDHVNQVYLLLSSFVLFDTALVMSRCWRWEVCRAQMCKVKTSSGKVDEQFFSMVMEHMLWSSGMGLAVPFTRGSLV